MFKTFLLLVSIGLTIAGQAHAYGNTGHQVIGTIAAHYLEGTRAEKEVHALLKKDGLDRAATWADRAKLPEKYLTAEMLVFVTNNPGHHSYHYCDIPFQEKAYREGLTGTNTHDIVHILRICIRVLQTPKDNSDNSLKINKRVALMLIAHYLGDLHQPLHVGCSYVDANDHFINPETGATGQPDAGANDFHIKSRSGVALHGHWDTLAVKLAHDHAGATDFASFLIARSPPVREWEGAGPVTTWPVQWATDTLGNARQCFEGITPHDRFLVPKNEKNDKHFEWVITLPQGYAEKSRDLVELELAKAGFRLAALLKAIWPDEQGGTGQPATRSESKTKGSDKPQPQAEGRSR